MKIYKSKKELVDIMRAQITSRDEQAIKAMLKIYEYQTADEHKYGCTRIINGVGFTGTDSVILSSFCEQYFRKRYLSPKQLAMVKSKIGKYANQLVEQAIANRIYIKEGNNWIVNR